MTRQWLSSLWAVEIIHILFFTWAISWDHRRPFWPRLHRANSNGRSYLRRTMMITAGEGGENREWYPWDTRSSNFIKQRLCFVQITGLLRCGFISVKKQFFSGAAIPSFGASWNSSLKFGPRRREANHRRCRRWADRRRNRGRWLRAMAHPDENSRFLHGMWSLARTGKLAAY